MATKFEAARAPVARLRAKNQLTLPEGALAQVGASVGDRFIVIAEDGVIRLEPVRQSYAGTLGDMWPADYLDQLRRDRDSWPR